MMMEKKGLKFSCKLVVKCVIFVVLLMNDTLFPSSAFASSEYREALAESLLYFEAQRSGRLPYHQRVQWRGHSGLTDGLEQGVDLVGGYYDAGDNVKFGLPMAFTVTMLSWGVAEYGGDMAAAGELRHAMEAIKWGTDYFVKAHTQPHVLWAQVGDGDTDHGCWQRPEDMTTSRKAYKVDAEHPGSEVAAETAAAMAAASLVFKQTDPHYSHVLRHHAQQLFEFGDKYRGRYDESVESAAEYYPSESGYGDELLWAALWLHRATGKAEYLDYAVDNAHALNGAAWAVAEFSWDIKHAGVQILASKILMEKGRQLEEEQVKTLEEYRSKAEHYLCACLSMNLDDADNVRRTPAGLLFVRPWNNMQYVASAAWLLTVFADYLSSAGGSGLRCARGPVGPPELAALARAQVDYALGENPAGMSYLVGHGQSFPAMVHHRAASSASQREAKAFVGCAQGYDEWYARRGANPHILVGAVVGGPDERDAFADGRENYMQTEACTYNTAPLVGVFARLSRLEGDQRDKT
ncbi:endoglucanase 16-like [Zingiber officinale]|uniref:endoglucanase 16-like n=1 Tax=Zingiber officinale TaxID=94328 RepID=UPI001C4AD1CD|nr:endoglucanase 16-like [Zingiber officinale]